MKIFCFFLQFRKFRFSDFRIFRNFSIFFDPIHHFSNISASRKAFFKIPDATCWKIDALYISVALVVERTAHGRPDARNVVSHYMYKPDTIKKNITIFSLIFYNISAHKSLLRLFSMHRLHASVVDLDLGWRRTGDWSLFVISL